MEPYVIVLIALATFVLGVGITSVLTRLRSRNTPEPVEVPAESNEHIVAMQETLRSLQEDRLRQQGALSEQLRDMSQAQRELKIETTRLTGALSNNQVRGNWGEIQLRRVVELAGMEPNVDFVEQFQLESGAKRPDLIVKLPGNRSIIVDAKAPMTHYVEMMKGELNLVQQKAHANSLRQHVNSLSSKEYWKGLQGSAEFVVLFVPNEAALGAAVTTDGTLMEYAAERRVVLAGPSTLLAILFAVAQGWRQETAAANVEHIATLGLELYTRLQAMSQPFDDIQKKLDEAQEALKTTRWHMNSRIFVTGRKLQELTGSNKNIVVRDE